VDAVQSFGKIPMSSIHGASDLLSISAHKLHGAKGVGALYIKRGVKIVPIQFGGGQEYRIRSGTENVEGIVGFSVAVEKILNRFSEETAHVKQLKEKLIRLLSVLDDNIRFYALENSSDYILNASFKRIKSEVMLHHLSEQEIYVSSGSACSSKKKTGSHVLRAMGVQNPWLDGAIRFSFCGNNTIEEIQKAAEWVLKTYEKIRFK
jgi:cysteine desulfurase